MSSSGKPQIKNGKQIYVMKILKVFLLITILSVNKIVAQAVLEHTYTQINDNFQPENYRLPVFYTDNGINYYLFNRLTGILLIFDSTHTLTKTINLPFQAGQTQFQPITIISDKLFNNDSLIEFIVQYSIGGVFYLKLYNENGTILQTFPNNEGASIIKMPNNVFKLLTHNEFSTGVGNQLSRPFSIYSLPGTTLNITNNQVEENSFFAYPNPTNNTINIANNLLNGQSGILEIYDVNGKKIITTKIQTQDKTIEIDTTMLESGLYFAKLNDKTTKFIKQ